MKANYILNQDPPLLRKMMLYLSTNMNMLDYLSQCPFEDFKQDFGHLCERFMRHSNLTKVPEKEFEMLYNRLLDLRDFSNRFNDKLFNGEIKTESEAISYAVEEGLKQKQKEIKK